MNQYKKKILVGQADEVMANLKNGILNSEKTMLVTANSECFVNAETKTELKEILTLPETKIVIDGIAAYRAFKYLGCDNIVKIPGVEIVEELLKFSNDQSLKVAALGGTVESSNNFKKYVEEDFPNVDLVSIVDGYVENKEKVMQDISLLAPDIILVALGVPAQEILIGKSLKYFEKGLFIGCGGSLDVLGKTKRRAPKFFRVTSTEWLYRIVREPKRMGRFAKTNYIFGKMVRKSKKNVS